MNIFDFILLSTCISTFAFVMGERMMIARRRERRRVIIMGLTARMADRDETARNNWN
jgi:hypothetical protein